MKKLLLVIILATFSTLTTFSQIRFEEGYFIDNSDTRTSCLIRNVDWKNNPDEFEYKWTETSLSKIGRIDDIKEFGIQQAVKYIRAAVKIDTSTQKLQNLGPFSDPDFKDKVVFLKVITEGLANLYVYQSSISTKYFYKTGDGNPEQLIYKIYRIGETGLGKNMTFHRQLINSLKSDNILQSEILNTSYNLKDLARLFIKYNHTGDKTFTNYLPAETKRLHLSIRPMINFTSLDVKSRVDFGSKTSFSAGIELEYVLPFNKGKWSIPIEVNYQYFKVEDPATNGKNMVDFSAIAIPFGLRYSMFLNDRSKAFINASYVAESLISNKLTLNRYSVPLEIKPNKSFALGLGYLYDKFGAELRYYTQRNILSIYSSFDGVYNNLSFILNYRIF